MKCPRKQVLGWTLLLSVPLILAFWWAEREPAEGPVRVGEVRSDFSERVEAARPQPPMAVAPMLPPRPQDSNPKVIVSAQRRTPDGIPFGHVQITDSSDHGWPVRIETVFPPGGDETSDAAVTTRMVADRFLVELAPDADRRKAAEVLEKLGIMAQPIHRSAPILNARISDFEHEDALPLSIEIARRALGSTAVTVEPDYLVQTHGLAPNDPSYPEQWALLAGSVDANIRAPDGWAIDNDASEIVVAIIDSGIRLTHEDLRDNLWVNAGEIPDNQLDDDANGYIDDIHGIDAINGTGDPSDAEGHGTHVAGIIGARGNNGIGISGVAWKVGLMPIRFLGSNGEGATSDAVISIEYAIENGADIINASWGGPGRSSVLESAIRRAGEAGILFVASAGNSGKVIDYSPVYPAGFVLHSLVAVASVEPDGRLSTFSNRGNQRVALAAPGGNIISCQAASDNAYGHASGTSMAAPHVSGAAALLLSAFGSVQPEVLVDRLYRTTRPIDSLNGEVASGGTLDLHRALSDTSSNPPNDDFGNAVEINGSSFRYTGTTSFATGQPGEPNPFATATTRSVWFVLTTSQASQAHLRVSYSQFETGIAVFRGTALENLVQVTTQSGSNPELVFEIGTETPHYIRIDPVDDNRGLYELTVEIPVPNDAFSQPMNLIGESFAAVGDNRRATRESGEPDHAGHSPNRSLWWSWTAPQSDYFVLSTFGSDHNTTLAIYEGTTLVNLSLIAENNNATEGVVFSSVSFNPVAGRTYRIATDSPSPTGGVVKIQGTYDFEIRFIVQPDDQNTTHGANVVFNSRAEGPPPLSYQWFRDDEPIPGGTDAVLRLTSVSEADLGDYQVRARGPEAEAFSRRARLHFGGRPPRILAPPVGSHNYLGESIRLRARVEGAAPLVIQWFRDDQPIKGATRDSLLIPEAEAGHAGSYFVRVSNNFGSTDSDPVAVTVNPMAHDGWHFRFPSQSPGVRKVSFLNGQFLAYGSDGTIYTSSDGDYWEPHRFPQPYGRIEQIQYGNNKYIARTYDGDLWVAGEDLQWTGPVIEEDFRYAQIVFGKGLFLAETRTGLVTSPNGSEWTTRYEYEKGPAYIAYIDGTFLAVWYGSGSAGRASVATSPDGKSWETPKPVDQRWYEFAAIVEGALHLFQNWRPSVRTTDGINWEPGPVLAGGFGKTFIHQGRLFYFFEYDDDFRHLPVGAAEDTSRTIASHVVSVAYGNSRFVIADVNGNLQVVRPEPDSPLPTLPDLGPISDQGPNPRLSFVNDRFYINGGQLLSSSDGAHWTISPSVASIAYGNGIYTTGALTGYSTDYLEPNLSGQIWEPTGLVFGIGTFVGIDGRTVIASEDGQTWTGHELNPWYGFVDIVYGNGRFVVVGNATIATSSNGYDWTEMEFLNAHTDEKARFTGITFGHDEYVAATDNGILYRSTDGLTWNRFEHGFRGSRIGPDELAPLRDIAFGDNTFMAISDDWIFRSANLEEWTRSPSPTPALRSIVFGNGTFVAATGRTIVQLGQSRNAPPLVAIEEPSDEFILAHSAKQRFRVRASDPEGRLIRVRLLANGTEIGNSDTGLLEVGWTPPKAGSYTIVAQADDANDLSALDSIRLRVRGPTAQPVSYPERPINAISAVLFRNQYFVRDAAGNLWRSSDLQHWAVVYFPKTKGGGRLVANDDLLLIGSSPTFAVTRDGFSFVEVDTPGNGRTIYYLSDDGENGIVAGTDDQYYQSFDGLNWEILDYGGGNYHRPEEAFTEGKIMLRWSESGSTSIAQVSIDGETWHELPILGSISVVRFGDYYFAANHYCVYRSEDLINWEIVHCLPQRGGSDTTKSKLVAGPAGLLLCNANGVGLGYSVDGQNWIQFEDPPTYLYEYDLVALAYGNGVWVASTYGKGLRIGTDLRNLESTGPDAGRAFFDGTRFLATSGKDFNTLHTSTNGRDWQTRTVEVPEDGSLRFLAYLKDSGQYLVRINPHHFYTTENFIDWTYGEFPEELGGEIQNVNGHVVISTRRSFSHTTDGVNWHRVAFENQYGWLRWANGTYLVFIYPHNIAVSTDLQQWEIHPLPDGMPEPGDLWVQPTDEGFYISLDRDPPADPAFFTPDGIHWERTEPPARYGGATFANGHWYYLSREVKAMREIDLELLSVNATAGNYVAGDSIEVTLVIQNESNKSMNLPEGLTINGHLNNEHTWNPRAETDLGTATVGPIVLEPQEVGTFKIHMTAPTKAAPGTHDLAVWIDSLNRIPEQNEFNNYAWSLDAPIEIVGHILRTSTIGGGSIEILPFRQRYAHNALVTLVPVEAPGYVFSGWEGVSESYQDTVTIRMDTDREITARFSRVFTIVTEAEGEGDIAVLPDEGIYLPGTEIEVKATPSSGWVFGGWTGDQSGDQSKLKFAIEGDTRIVARFHLTADRWKETTFTSAQLGDPEISGDLADPDGDGSINQAEFLFGTNALDPASLPWARIVRTNDRLAVRFPVRPFIDHTRIDLETSSDISEWTSVIVTYSRIQTGSELDIVEAELIDPPDDTVFVRFVIRETTN